MIKATVSGSFRRHMSAIYEAVNELIDRGVEVLSPADPRVVDQIGEFVFVASDQVRSIKMVEDRHLECIAASSFLWLVTPDGYVGQSASMELGYAIAHHTPIYSLHEPSDGTLKKYVQVVPTIEAALERAAVTDYVAELDSFLIRPLLTIELAHDRLESMKEILTRPRFRISDKEGQEVLQHRSTLTRLLALRYPSQSSELPLQPSKSLVKSGV